MTPTGDYPFERASASDNAANVRYCQQSGMPYKRQMGWECPKCGGVYAPNVPQCFKCGRQQGTTVSDINAETEIFMREADKKAMAEYLTKCDERESRRLEPNHIKCPGCGSYRWTQDETLNAPTFTCGDCGHTWFLGPNLPPEYPHDSELEKADYAEADDEIVLEPEAMDYKCPRCASWSGGIPDSTLKFEIRCGKCGHDFYAGTSRPKKKQEPGPTVEDLTIKEDGSTSGYMKAMATAASHIYTMPVEVVDPPPAERRDEFAGMNRPAQCEACGNLNFTHDDVNGGWRCTNCGVKWGAHGSP